MKSRRQFVLALGAVAIAVPDLDPEFEREFLAFPVGSHDDMVDAAVYAFAAGAYNIGPPPDYSRGGLPRIVPI